MSLHADGRRNMRSDEVHIQSVNPDVILPIQNASGEYIYTVPGDSMASDAFGRQRVSNPVGVHASQLQYDLDRIIWEDVITDNSGSATVTHQADRSSAFLTVGANDTIVRQSRKYYRYQPGKSQKVAVTSVPGYEAAGITKRFGHFDDDNGIFFEMNGADLFAVTRSNVTGTAVDTQYPRTQWLDPLDGTGASGFNLNLSKSQIFWLDLEWLGVGRTRCGFQINGQYIEIIRGNHTNVVDSVYMTTANLPVRYEVSATAGFVGTNVLEVICSEVSSEGGLEYPNSKPFTATNGRTLISVGTTLIPLISIRPKATFNSIANRGLIIPESIEFFSATQGAHYKIVWGATLTSPSWTSVGADSITEYDVSASAYSGGIAAVSGYVSSGGRNQSSSGFRSAIKEYPLFLDVGGAHPTSPYTDSITVVAVSMVAQSTDMTSSINFGEVR